MKLSQAEFEQLHIAIAHADDGFEHQAIWKAAKDYWLEQAAKVCDEMVDWPLEKHPAATASGPLYEVGITRGLVNATNAVRQLKDKHG